MMACKVAVPARAAVLSALRVEEGLENRMVAPVPTFEHILKCGNDSVLLGVPGSFPFIGEEFSYAHTLVTRLISRAADWLPALWDLSSACVTHPVPAVVSIQSFCTTELVRSWC